MPAIIKELFEDHGTAAARTIHRALTMHRNLLNQWITLIQTDRCHDLMTGRLNFYYGGVMTCPCPLKKESHSPVTLDILTLT
jgi:hypothetical protein